MIEYQEHRPDPRLDPFVQCLWELRTPARARAESACLERVLPDGCMEWVFHLGPPFRIDCGEGRLAQQAPALLVGVTTRAVLLEPSSGGDVVGVRFRPGGARPFLRQSADRWTDQVLPLEVLEDVELTQLLERLQAAPRAQRIGLLAQALLERAARSDVAPSPLAGAIRTLLSTRVSIDRVTRACGLSSRQLERRFQDEVGVGPKKLARLGRLQRSARWLVASGAGASAIAQAAGYADQAHFVREFQALAGTTPGRYRRERAGLGPALLGPAEQR